MGKKHKHIKLIGDESDAVLSIVESIISPTSTTIKLYDTRDISFFENNKKAYNLIASLLNYNDRRMAILASIFNAIFTQKTDCFNLSRKIINDLMKNDTNHQFDGIHPSYYGPFMLDCHGNGVNEALWEEVVPQTGSNPVLIRLRKDHQVYEILSNLISEEILECSFQKKYEYHMTALKTNTGKLKQNTIKMIKGKTYKDI